MIINRAMSALMLAIAIYLPSERGNAQTVREPLRIIITEGVIEPMPIALPTFATNLAADRSLARQLTEVIASDLAGTGLFRQIPPEAYISAPGGINERINFVNWKAINAQALVAGSLTTSADRMVVNFRLFDVFAESELGQGMSFEASQSSVRRVAHKIADTIYQRITGEAPYFDSRVAYISESGPKDGRRKQLAIMDYDGANLRPLTNQSTIVLAPRFSPDGSRIIYTSYETGVPNVYLIDIESGNRQSIIQSPNMAFAPRFSPNGSKVVLSLAVDGNTDIYEVEIGNRRISRLTNSSAIDTAPSFSPDGKWLVFESDRSGSQQIYVMRLERGAPQPRRISFGQGRYGTPVWSPTGDFIAFTKQHRGRFHIGVMRADGSEERLLTSSFLDEGPTWSPNGRTLMFFRETPGTDGGPSIYSVDIYGRNLRSVPTPQYGSDPAWSPQRN